MSFDLPTIIAAVGLAITLIGSAATFFWGVIRYVQAKMESIEKGASASCEAIRRESEARVEGLRKETSEKVAELHRRIDEIRAEYVRRDDLQQHLQRIDNSLDAIQRTGENINHRIDELVKIAAERRN